MPDRPRAMAAGSGFHWRLRWCNVVVGFLAVAMSFPGDAGAQVDSKPKRGSAASKPADGLAATQTIMAGSPLLVAWRGPAPEGEAAFALALPDAAPGVIIEGTVARFGKQQASLAVPGSVGTYELRLLRRDPQGVTVVARQSLVAMEPQATVTGPKSVWRGTGFPARGSGPNGERDIVTIVRPDAAPDAQDSVFMPADSIEGRLDAPMVPGTYELRYVMIAPLSGAVVLARQPVTVE